MTLKNRIMQKKAAIGVIGLGYVGLPLAVEFGKAGFHVVGIDLDEEKIKEINKGESYIPDIWNKNIKKLMAHRYFMWVVGILSDPIEGIS